MIVLSVSSRVFSPGSTKPLVIVCCAFDFSNVSTLPIWTAIEQAPFVMVVAHVWLSCLPIDAIVQGCVVTLNLKFHEWVPH